MNKGQTVMFFGRWITGILLLVSAMDVPAEESSRLDRYKRIIDRNAFGLEDPPPPPVEQPTVVAKPPPAIDIYFTGVSTLTGEKVAYLKTENKKDKDVNYYKLREGEAQDGIEMVAIFPEKGVIQVKFLGDLKNMNLDDNSAPSSAAPAQKPVAVAPGNAGRPNNLPNRNPRAVPPPATPGHSSSFTTRPPSGTQPPAATPFQRTMRTLQQNSQGGGGNIQVQTPNGLQNIRLRNGSINNSSIDPEKRGFKTTVPDVDPAVQRAMMELDQFNADGIPMPPLPPMPDR